MSYRLKAGWAFLQLLSPLLPEECCKMAHWPACQLSSRRLLIEQGGSYTNAEMWPAGFAGRERLLLEIACCRTTEKQHLM